MVSATGPVTETLGNTGSVAWTWRHQHLKKIRANKNRMKIKIKAKVNFWQKFHVGGLTEKRPRAMRKLRRT